MPSGLSSGLLRQGLWAPVPPGVTLSKAGCGTQCRGLADRAVSGHRLDSVVSKGFSKRINFVTLCEFSPIYPRSLCPFTPDSHSRG